MSKPESIKIDDVEYVRADAATKCEGDIKIVVADRGFVFIGRVKHCRRAWNCGLQFAAHRPRAFSEASRRG